VQNPVVQNFQLPEQKETENGENPEKERIQRKVGERVETEEKSR